MIINYVQEITKKAKNKVRNEYNWSKISQDTHFAYQKAICQIYGRKTKKRNRTKKEPKKLKKQKIQKKKSQTYWISRKDMHMRKKFGWDNLSQPDFFNF